MKNQPFSLILILLFIVNGTSKSIDFVSATTVCGAGAVEITFSEEINPTTVNYSDFNVQGVYSTSHDRIPVAGAYADPTDHKKVVVFMVKQAVRWIPNAVAYSNITISYSGTTLQDINGVQVPTFTSQNVTYVNILNNSSEFIKPLPENFNFEQNLWGKNQTSWVITDTIHVDNRNPVSSDNNTGSREFPLKTISKAISLGGAGKVVFVHNGIYPEEVQIKLNKSGTVNAPFILQGEDKDSVIVSGNDNWTDSTWVQSGNFYVCNWPYKWGLNFDSNTVPLELGRHRENLYVNGNKYDQVLSLATMRAKTYYVSNTEGKVYLQLPSGITPKMVKIEVSTRSNGITIGDPWNPLAWISYFVIKNMQFSYFNNSNTIQGKHYLVENCKFQWNNDEGANTGGLDYLLRNCIFTYNGRSGIDIPPRLNTSSEYFSVNGLIENCEMNNNNWRVGIYGGQRGWFLGGAKVHGCFNLIIRGCSFRNNAAPGLWMDNKVNNALVEDCLVANNSENGIWSEIGYGNTIIRNCTISKNNTGICMSNTGYLRSEGNLFVDNNGGQVDSWEPNQNREEAFKSIYPVFKHNVMYGKTIYNTPKWSSFYSTIAVDSNYYQNNSINSFNGMPLAIWKSTIQNAQKQSIPDSKSLTDNFLFRNSANLDFTPQYSSQLANSPDWAFVNIVSMNDSTYALESNKSDVQIRYTTNGFLPIKTSAIYSSPVILKKGQVLAARAYKISNGINTIFSPVAFATNAQQLNVRQLQITGQKDLTTLENVSLLIKNTDLILNTDAFLDLLPGENYSVEENVITPAKDFVGNLTVNAKVIGFNGAIPSEIFPLKISVLKNSTDLSNLKLGKIHIYPNPCEDELNIISSEDINQIKYEIFNSNGQLLLNQTIKFGNKWKLNTHFLDKGVYFLRISSKDEYQNFEIFKQ